MNDGAVLARRRALLSPARLTAILLWSASVLVLALLDRQVFFFALAVVGYAFFLWAVGAWLLPGAGEPSEVLRTRATGRRLAARCAVVGAAGTLVFCSGAALAGMQSGATVPLLTPLFQTLGEIHLWPGVGGIELWKVASYVIVPGAVLMALGARAMELGLRLPSVRTTLATLVCLVPSATFVGWGVWSGRLSAAGLFLLLIHNLFSNGFSEEFLCRGMMLSHLRAFLDTDWALLIQALLFALLHFHPTGAEEQQMPLRSLAEDIALNLPLGLAFGYLALRSRSLVLPTLLHLFRWTP